MSTVVIIHNDAPPSASRNNGIGGRGDPRTIARTKRQWQGIFAMLLLDAKLPKPLVHVQAKPMLEFKTGHRRDADNYYLPISKPLGDALVRGGWIKDDTPNYFVCEHVEIFTRLQRLPPLVTARLTIELEFTEYRDEAA